MDFEEIYTVYFKDVYLYVLRMAGDTYLAEDINANTSMHKTERELFKKRLARMMTVLSLRVVQVLTVAYTCFLVFLFSYEAVRLENDSFEVIIAFLYIFISYLPLYLAEWSAFQDVKYFLCLPKTSVRTAFHGFSIAISFVWTVVKFLQLSRLLDGLWIIHLDYVYLLLWVLCRFFMARQGKMLEKYNKI